MDADALLERQLGEWLTAAAAFRAKDSERVADALVARDSGRPAREIYADSVSMLIVGAVCAATKVAKALGVSIGNLPDDIEVRIADLQPHHEMAGAERFAVSLVIDAANCRFESMSGRVNAYARPDAAGVDRVMQTTVALLRLHDGYAEAVGE